MRDVLSYKFQFRSFSECGPRRKNEDSIGIVEFSGRNDTLFILCDGMGGHRNGEVASKTIVNAFDNFWRANYKRLLCAKKIVDAADEAMVALNKLKFLGMGTTMALIAIDGNRFFMAHCGDSRIYYCIQREEVNYSIVGHIRDHIKRSPEGWPYLNKGFIQRESKHIPEIHEFKIRLKKGDRFIICSDGVYNAFKINEIEELMKSSVCIDELTDSLYERCKTAAQDNFSAIIVEIA